MFSLFEEKKLSSRNAPALFLTATTKCPAVDPDTLDDLITEIQKVQYIMKESGASSLKLWLGETSSAYGGGVPGVSDSYIAGFMWLDKLGIAARLQHNVVIRQTFYGGSYSLINTKTLDPFPDYWSSFLYKKLVGSRVLEVHDGISLGSHSPCLCPLYIRGI